MTNYGESASAWEADYMKVTGVPVSWPPSSEEIALNRRLVAVCQRLREKGQYTTDEDET
jgi:hypothetical protein